MGSIAPLACCPALGVRRPILARADHASYFLNRLALMPRQVVADLLNLSIADVESLSKEKQVIIA